MLVLASGSPRRRELLRLIAPEFEAISLDLDERAIHADTPAALVEKLAAAKAEAAAALRPADLVLGCDTVVDLDGAVLGKPKDAADAAAMLRALSGRSHLVHTGVCAISGDKRQSLVETTKVYFDRISEEDLAWYLSTDEPWDKAGGYAVQGLAARFIPRIEGCYHNVMGLPVAALYRMLSAFGQK